jgi:hypothetical protein
MTTVQLLVKFDELHEELQAIIDDSEDGPKDGSEDQKELNTALRNLAEIQSIVEEILS